MVSYYCIERSMLSETKYEKQISRSEAISLTQKACEEFNLPVPKIIFRGKKFSQFTSPPDMITYTTLDLREVGDVAHEVAHYIQFSRDRKTRHNEKFLNEVIRVQGFLDRIILNT